MFRFHPEDLTNLDLGFFYVAEKELNLVNFSILFDNGEWDGILVGGQNSRGDRSGKEFQKNGKWLLSNVMHLTPNVVSVFLNNTDQIYNFLQMEINYGHNVVYQFPPELFLEIQKLRQKAIQHYINSVE